MDGNILKSTENKADVSINHDLVIGIMNLIAIEEHLFFTGAKTGKTQYYDMISDIREMRKELLKKIIKEYEGEIWCTSKHLLTASMRMMEVGTKEQTLGNNQEAYTFFEKSYNLYMMFWALNMNQKIDLKDIDNENKIDNFITKINNVKDFISGTTQESILKDKNKKEEHKNPDKNQKKSGFSFTNLKKFIAEKLDCCRE